MGKKLSWFYIFTEYRKAIEMMSPELLKKTMLRLFDYFDTGEYPEGLNDTENFAFFSLKKGVEVAKEHFESRSKAGKKGMEARWSKDTESLSKSPDKKAKLDKNLDKPTDEKPEKSKKFKPPTLEEVTAYIAEIGSSVDPEYFYNYQQARDWVLSTGKKMKDWKATIKYWNRNNV